VAVQSKDTVTLTIGYHQLEGKKVPLKKPLAVLERDEAKAGEGGIAYKASIWCSPAGGLLRTGGPPARPLLAARRVPGSRAAERAAPAPRSAALSGFLRAAGGGGRPQQVPLQDAAQAAHHQATGPVTPQLAWAVLLQPSPANPGQPHPQAAAPSNASSCRCWTPRALLSPKVAGSAQAHRPPQLATEPGPPRSQVI
jgi:pyruvate/2-oxoglutarate dehydrogenase complex dihydrolipoamide acyltransferase (E2) component